MSKLKVVMAVAAYFVTGAVAAADYQMIMKINGLKKRLNLPLQKVFQHMMEPGTDIDGHTSQITATSHPPAQ